MRQYIRIIFAQYYFMLHASVWWYSLVPQQAQEVSEPRNIGLVYSTESDINFQFLWITVYYIYSRLPISMERQMMNIANPDTAGILQGSTYMGLVNFER